MGQGPIVGTGEETCGGSLGVGAAGSNSKKRVKRKKTTFAHQTQVTSATATVVYVPLSALEVGSGNHSLRTKLANIVSEQNTESVPKTAWTTCGRIWLP